ncbi:MAG: RtcB family protein [Armatimonadota bacterium]
MASKYDGPIKRLDEHRWEIPRDDNAGMITRGIIYASDALMEEMRTDPALQQVANVACLPGIVGSSMAMPDIHYGYGFAIGGVAAFDVEEGVISPGGVGYDINCGVRLLRSDLTKEELMPHLRDLVEAVFAAVPAGVGKKGQVRIGDRELRRAMTRGARWAVEQGMGEQRDLEHCEENGCLELADADAVSPRAHQRGRPQLGTLGSGNHFLEVQLVDEIFDQEAARALGIEARDQVTFMIHTGSRGFGHQICDDYLEEMQRAAREYDLRLPDRQLACAPVGSPEGQRYLAAMACAANYAWANRQVITHRTRSACEQVFRKGSAALGLDLVYDVAHNMAKLETHPVNGQQRRLCVHRKGATRAFGPGLPEVPEAYRGLGQPVIVPGDMGTYSYLLVGTEGAMRQTWGSTCHGAGRRLSRSKALKTKHGKQVYAELRAQGIEVKSVGTKTLAEEMPEAYKDVNEVVNTCHGAGISRKVCRLRPVGVMKG